MKIILFGATGMVGQGVLRECLLDPEVTRVLSVGRGKLPPGTLGRLGSESQASKLREIIHQDFANFSSLEGDWKGYDACFFCMGVSSVGLSEETYRHLTYDFALAAGGLLARLNPGMTFIYVSGAGTDSTEKGKVMWARVKGGTENALLALPFKAAYMFRPGLIQPMDGILPRNRWLGVLLTRLGFLIILLRALFPRYVTTTRLIGRAMLNAARNGFSKKWVESWDINELGQTPIQD